MSVTLRTFSIALLIFTFPVRGYDVLVSVTGNLIGNTCVVAADSKEQDVPLGTIGIKQFPVQARSAISKRPSRSGLKRAGQPLPGSKSASAARRITTTRSW